MDDALGDADGMLAWLGLAGVISAPCVPEKPALGLAW
jgi:hypothetical protein